MRAFVFVNEQSFATLVLPARKAMLRGQFRMRYASLLHRVGIRAGQITRELRAVQKISTGPSSSRPLLGVLNDLVQQYRAQLLWNPSFSADSIEERLLENMVSTNGYRRPTDVILERFST